MVRHNILAVWLLWDTCVQTTYAHFYSFVYMATICFQLMYGRVVVLSTEAKACPLIYRITIVNVAAGV